MWCKDYLIHEMYSHLLLTIEYQTYYSLDISQPHLAWTLVTKASELCQTLGYHHIGRKSEDSKRESSHQQRLFWLLYVMDKSLSLRLGRASTIQDWDVTIPLPESTLGNQASDRRFVPLLALSVKIARCQGSIQEFLYSPTSLALPDQTRHSRAQILETQLGGVGEDIRASIVSILATFMRTSPAKEAFLLAS